MGKDDLLSRIKLNENNLRVYAMLMSTDKLIDAHLAKDKKTITAELDMWAAIFSDYFIQGEAEELNHVIQLFMYAVGFLALQKGISTQEWLQAYEPE